MSQPGSYSSSSFVPPSGVALGWRGKLRRQLQEFRYRWQRDSSDRSRDLHRSRASWRRLRILGLLGLFLALMALLVYELWFRPIQTPMITLSAPAYSWPVPPQGWTQEDLQAFAALERQGSIHVLDAGSTWRTSESALAALDRQLRLASKQGAGSGTVVLYVSMVGVVDAAGQPALIPPGASPLRSDTWLKVSDLLQKIKAQHLPDQWHKLLILDCNRIDVDWNMGLLANTFAEKLPEVVAEKQIPNLVVLNSTGPGQVGWSSKELVGSVFGHYLQVGLAGAADTESEGGNGDHQVSLFELRDYLRKRVDGWAKHNRADHQTPILIPETATDFNIVWALNKSAQSRLAKATAAAGSVSAPTNMNRDLSQLWQTHDRLARMDVLRFDPLGWRDFEHKLLWLEQASAAGEAYRTPVRAMLRELKSLASAADDKAGKPGEEVVSIFAKADLLSDRESKRPPPVAHSLPLANFFGMPPSDAAQVMAQLARFQKAPSEASVDELLARTKSREPNPPLVELQLARLLKSQLSAQAWQHPATAGRAMTIQTHAERAAVPADERTQPWIGPVIASGDRANRQARDGLFAGDGRALSAADSLYDDADRRYGHAEQLSQSAAAAYALRDRAYAEIPYLAQWLARPLPPGQSSKSLDLEINDSLLPLIYANHALATTLAAEEAAMFDAASDSPAFDQQEQQVRRRLDHLHELLANQCDTLQKTKRPGGQAVRDLYACLDTPLIPAGQREELRKLTARLSGALNGETDNLITEEAKSKSESEKTADEKAMGQSSSGKSSKSKSAKSASGKRDAGDAEDNDSIDYLQRCAIAWQEHPALAILAANPADREPVKPDRLDYDGKSSDTAAPSDSSAPIASDSSSSSAASATKSPDAKASGVAETIAGQSARVRELLDTLPARLRHMHDKSVSAAASGAGEGAGVASTADAIEKPISLATPRAAAAEAERLTRAAASLGLPALDVDPIRRLRQWDLQRMLFAQSGRLLDDFWGATAGQSDPFFATAASDYLRAAQALGEIEPALLIERNRLAKLLERRRSAARAGVRIAASDVLLINEAENVTIKLGVGLNRESGNRGAPTEHVTVFVRDGKGRIEGTTQSLDLPATQPGGRPLEMLEFKLPTAALNGRGPMLEAVALLRTNAFVTPFLLQPTGGARIDVKPFSYGPPQVTVAGRSRKRASIVIILDCSASMSEMTELESPGGTQRLPRLEAAKIALHEMLSQLAQEGDTRVGVIFYGHRVGWNLKKPDQILRQTEFARTIPDELRPSEDVEQVLPLGRFDTVVAGGVYELMKSLKPWGETPLYLSVIDAIGNFTGDEPDTEKSIIVITDGANYQFNSPSPKRLQDVLAAMGQKKIPVHIVGFGIPANESAIAAKEFGTLADQTGGSFSPVASGTSVVRALENLLGPKTFTLFDPSGSQIGQTQIGQVIAVNPKPSLPQLYTVAMGPLTERIELAGGESAQFVLSADGKSLDALGYAKGDPVFGPLVAGDSGLDTNWRLGVHRPVRNNEGARFPISIQRTDRQFTTRPAETWIEITPVVDGKRTATTPYIYYDANFEPRTTAPVLDWFADAWPGAATQAEVRGWIKYSHTKPDWTVKLKDVANQLPANGLGASLEGLPGVSYQVRSRRGEAPGSPMRVAVIERHEDNSAGLGSLKVELYPQPAHIVHRFDQEHSLATHIFEIDQSDEQTAGNYELRFTRRDSVQSGAMQLAEPIVRRVVDGSDVIRGEREKSASDK